MGDFNEPLMCFSEFSHWIFSVIAPVKPELRVFGTTWRGLPSLKVLEMNAVIYREKGTSQSKLKADSEISVTLL